MSTIIDADGCDACDGAEASWFPACMVCKAPGAHALCDGHARDVLRGRIVCVPLAFTIVTTARTLGVCFGQGGRSDLRYLRPRAEVLRILRVSERTLQRANRIVNFLGLHADHEAAFRSLTMRGADTYIARYEARQVVPPDFTPGDDVIRCGDAAELLAEVFAADALVTDPEYPSLDQYRLVAEAAANGAVRIGAPVLVVCTEDNVAAVLDVMRRHLTFAGKVFPLDCTGRDGRWASDGGRSYAKLALVFTNAPRLSTRIVTKTIKSAGQDRKWHDTMPLDLPLAIEILRALRLPRGALVLDPYTGGATFPIACRVLGLRCRATEIDPEQARKAQYRWATFPHGETYGFPVPGEKPARPERKPRGPKRANTIKRDDVAA